LQACAVTVKVQIINISSERILDFSPDSRNSKDDVRRNNGSRDSRPAELCAELERKDKDVEPGDLGNGDGVCDWKWSAEDTFTTTIGVHHKHDTRRDLRLPARALEGAVLDAVFEVGGEVIHNFEREVPVVLPLLTSYLDGFLRVGFTEWEAKMFTPSLEFRAVRENAIMLSSRSIKSASTFGEGVEMVDERFEVSIVSFNFMAKLVLDGLTETQDEVDSRAISHQHGCISRGSAKRLQFTKKVILALLVLTLIRVYPDDPCQISRMKCHLSPEFSPFRVPLVCC